MPGALRALIAFLLAFALFAGVTKVVNPALFGDEPHYALEAVSIASDGDTDMANQYNDARLMLEIYGASSLDYHAFEFPGGHGLRSVHSPGLPLLLAPAALVTHSVFWMRVEVALIAAIGAALLMLLLQRIPFGREWQRWAAWAAVVLSPPVIVFAGQLFPEWPAATLLLGATVLLLRPDRGPWTMAGVGALAGALPWINVRFLSLTIALAVIAMWVVWQSPRRTALIAALLAPLVLSGVVMTGAFQYWYGTWSPSAQYSLSESPRTGPGIWQGSLANIYSAYFGWLPAVPLTLLAIVGIGVVVARLGRAALAAVLGIAFYLFIINVVSLGSGGTSFAGRLSVVLMPFVAVALLVLLTIKRQWWWRAGFALLGLLTLALTVNTLRTKAEITPIYNTTAFKSYTDIWPDLAGATSQGQVSWVGFPRELSGPAGRLSPEQPGTTPDQEGSRMTPAGVRGIVAQGTTPLFPPSAYDVGVQLRIDEETTADVATIELTDEDGTVRSRRVVPGSAVPLWLGWRAFFLSFHTPDAERLTFTVRSTGVTNLWVSAMRVNSNPGATREGVRGYPSVGRAIEWTVGLALLAVLAWWYDRRQRGRAAPPMTMTRV
jgi:hypothetical protein